ncbi:hypothetical protein EFY79_10005 [Hanamia caeni]|jgi:hypothetical protein|uniref:Outer membrane protein beta-barrel domain-containing protein n=1 Tax=Hanamia caeni TaxID=2294116 RepID=A0A3M9NFT1_9BACT|nr:hypothetical protein [Hanamia caeni]RNI36652.1 hypothetical protein EFY79_10005 [Hanamia caeni]
MKRTILILALVGLSTLGANAQTKPRLSIAANIGAPTTSGYSFAYGADLQADFGVASTTFITLSGGYEGYSWKGGGSSGIIPLLAGAKFFFGEANKLYGHAQLGYAFSSKGGGGGAFAYAPSLGYYVNPNFDIALKYLASSKNESTVGSLNVRFAYNF